jgi:hypothetical protein
MGVACGTHGQKIRLEDVENTIRKTRRQWNNVRKDLEIQDINRTHAVTCVKVGSRN